MKYRGKDSEKGHGRKIYVHLIFFLSMLIIFWLATQDTLNTSYKLVEWKLKKIANCSRCCHELFEDYHLQSIQHPKKKPELPHIYYLDLYRFNIRKNCASMINWSDSRRSSSSPPQFEHIHRIFFDCSWAKGILREVYKSCGVVWQVQEAWLERRWLITQFTGKGYKQRVL